MDSDMAPVLECIDSHRPDMIEFLRDYIGYRSPTEGEAEVQREFVRPFFESEMAWDDVSIVDVSAGNDRPNVNAVLRGSGDGEGLLFNGHSDIVDVPDRLREEKWTKDPWEAVVEDGRIYGRGSSDMKGPNTAMIWAAKAIMESAVELQGDLLMSVVVGEERCQQDVGSIPATNHLLDQTEGVPFCINTEPTSNEIHVKSSAVFNLDVTFDGKAIHASQYNALRYPQRHGIPDGSAVGVDTLPFVVDLLERLRKLEHQWNLRYSDEVWGSGGYPVAMDHQGVGLVNIVPTVVSAEGGHIASVADGARIRGQIYVPPFADPAELIEELDAVIDGMADTYDWLKEHPPEVAYATQLDEDRESEYWPAFSVPVEHPACQALGRSVESITGSAPVYSGFKAVSDAGFIQNVCGVDAICFGPGDTSLGAHGPDEYLPLDQFVTATKIYAKMIADWCG